MAYITVPELAEYLGLTEPQDDVLLSSLIASAQTAVESWTGKTFEAAADTLRYVDCETRGGGLTLILPTWLAGITSVVNGDGATVSASEYVTEPRYSAPYYELRMRVSSGKVWTYSVDPEGAIAITGRWAYSVTPPDDVKQAVKRYAAWTYRQRDNASESDRAMIAGNTTILPSRTPADVQALLAAYKVRT